MAAPNVAWNEGYVGINGIDVHYFRSTVPPSSANALPILIFFHGIANGGALQIPYMSLLADEFDVILPDSRGCCKSQPIPRGSFTMDNLVADGAALIRHFSPKEPAFVVGHSAGASVSARIARDFPDLVKALVLEDPPWFRTPDQPLNPEERSILFLLPHIRELKAMSDEEFVKYDVRGANLTPPAISLQAAFRQFDIEDCEDTFQETDDEVNVAVEGVKVPALLMRGDKETGSRCKAEVAEKVVAGWPQGKILRYEGGSHVLHLMRDRWISDVRSFLKNSGTATI